MRLFLIALALFVASAACSSRTSDLHTDDIFVSTTGHDDADGTRSKPLRSLSAAQKLLSQTRSQDSATNVVIHLLPGTYPSAVTLTNVDAGADNATTTIQADGAGKVVLTGAEQRPARQLSPAQATALTGAVRTITAIDLTGIAATPTSDVNPLVMPPTDPALINDGLACRPAQYPNPDSSFKIAAVVRGGTHPVVRIDGTQKLPQLPRNGTLRIFGHPSLNWWFQSLNVTAVDNARRTITLDRAIDYGGRAGQEFHFSGSPAFLDQPGECYVDQQTHTLYTLGSATDSPRTVTASLSPLVKVTSFHGLRIRGVSFENTRGDGIDIADSRSVSVENCHFTNMGVRAATVTNSTQTTFRSVTSEHSGGGGIWLAGGDRMTLSPSGNSVSGSRIEYFSETYPDYSAGIRLQGIGASASSNVIAHSSHEAIQVSGNDQVVQDNLIHDVIQSSSDAGAIYFGGGDWTERGNRVLNNFVCNAGQQTHDSVGVYLDNMESGVEVSGNLVANTPVGIQASGRDESITSNLTVGVTTPVNFGTWAKQNAGAGGPLMSSLAQMPYTSSTWTRHYPRLASILADQPSVARNNTVTQTGAVQSGSSRYEAEVRSTGSIAADVQLPAAALSVSSGCRAQVDAPTLKRLGIPSPIDLSALPQP